MGWFKDRVREIEGADVSLIEVARRLRKSKDWPRGVKLAASSLGTYLGQLDKGENRHLLKEHPRLRPLLAGYLNLPEDELDARLEGVREPGAQRDTRFFLWDAGTRPIDLSREPLPPAFPVEVLDPARYWPVMWEAPSGSSRTLVGRWLEARGLAVFIRAENWSEAERQLPSKGNVFVSLKSAEGIPKKNDLPRTLMVCLAVERGPRYRDPSPFPQEWQQEDTRSSQEDWKSVRSPPVEAWLKELVLWIRERRSEAEAFDTRACLAWLEREILPAQLIDGFGAAVGFIGLYADYRRQLERSSSKGATLRGSELARYFLRTRLHGFGGEIQVPRPAESLWKYLRQVARALLTRSERSWTQARSFGEWCELVPTEPSSVALEWLSRPDIRKRLKLDEHALRKEAEALPPDAFQMVRLLQDLRLLREERAGQYVLRPRWVLEAFLQDAADTLLSESPDTWGEALVRKHGAHIVLFRLIERFLEGDFSAVRQTLVERAPASPAWVAALEGSFVALGWTLLHGSEVPPELATEVFDVQQRLALDIQYLPFPRLGYGNDAGPFLLKQGAWLLAAHILSEQRTSVAGTDHPVLNPWTGGANHLPAGGLAFFLVRNVVSDKALYREARLGILELYGRMFRRAGAVKYPGDGPHDLQMPEFLLHSFEEHTLEWSYFTGYRKYREELILPLLRGYMERRGQSWEPFARALWGAWLASGNPLDVDWSPDGSWGLDWWSFIPPEAILDKRLKTRLERIALPYANFRGEQWEAFLTYWKQQEDPSGSRAEGEPWRHMPLPFIRRAIADDVIHHSQWEIRDVLWQVAPDVLREELRTLISQERWEAALSVAWSSPPEETRAITGLLREGSHQQKVLRHEVIRWLHHRIGLRAMGWEDAWTLFHEMCGAP